MESLSLLLSVCREEAEPRGKAKFSCFSRRRQGSTVGLGSLGPEVPEAAGKAAVNLSHGNVVAGNDLAKPNSRLLMFIVWYMEWDSRPCMHTSLLRRCSPVGPNLHLGRRQMELNHSLWRVSADSKPITDHLSQEKVFNLFINYIVHCGLRLSDVVCIHAGLCEHSGPLHSLIAFLSNLISFSQSISPGLITTTVSGRGKCCSGRARWRNTERWRRKCQVWQPWRLWSQEASWRGCDEQQPSTYFHLREAERRDAASIPQKWIHVHMAAFSF